MRGSPAEHYIEDVLCGDILTSRLVRLTIERHVRDLRDGKARGLRFDPDRAERAIVFFRFLRHSKGEWTGRPFELQAWQQALLWILFGWVRTATGYRRFRTAYNELARGAGKSTLAAGVGLYLLLADGEGGAEVYSAATKKDQARIVHSEAVRMVRQSPGLSARITIFRDSLSIADTASKFVPLASEEDSLDGLNIHGVIIDELHAHRSRKIWDVLVTAMGKRRQPLLFAITTAGHDRHSVCWEQRSYSEKVLAGIIEDDSWFCWIAGLDTGDDWEDEANWIKANPGLGETVRVEELRSQALKARESPASLNAFLRLRLNVWTTNVTAWMPLAKWDLCASPVDPAALKGRPCFAGLDLATTTDVAAVVLLFPPMNPEECWAVLPHFFLPSDSLEERVRRDRVPYDVWERQKLFHLTDGDIIDYDAIRATINALGAEYDIREIAFDRWNATQIVTQLAGDGFTMVEFGQGFQSMSAPTKRLLELVLSGDIAHGGNPVLRWMASNVTVRMDPAGNVKPDKSKSTEKIDGIVALIMALGRAMLAPPPRKPFVPFVL